MGMMDADTPFWPGFVEMLGGGYADGPRGIVIDGATTFPISMARGASWDRDLEKRIGEAIAKEARAAGANYFGGVCINLLRHPAWGRAQETYGEDSWHVGELASALIQGVQHHNVMACAKHFALNSIENSRFKVDVFPAIFDWFRTFLSWNRIFIVIKGTLHCHFNTPQNIDCLFKPCKINHYLIMNWQT